MKTGVGQAHAKVILIGEHSVVYRHPALSLPFKALHVNVVIKPSIKTILVSTLHEGDLDSAPEILNPIIQLIRQLQEHFDLQGCEINIDSNIPLGAGLGSSAALASAITKAFYHGMEVELNDQTLLQWIHVSETMAHGQPSGVDALTTSFDSAWIFTKGQPPVSLPLSLNAILVIAQTNEYGSTKEAVQKVASKVAQEGLKSIDELGRLTHHALSYIKDNELELLGKTLTQAHEILKHLGISTKTLDQCVEQALKHHALGAKLTGGGLGGCMIALAKDQTSANDIMNALKEITPHVWSMSLQ
jgi:mevalonate kinase